VADSDGHLLVGDQIFKLQFGGLVDDLGAARVAVAVADIFELLDDDATKFLLTGEDGFVLGDLLTDFDEFLENFVDGKLGEAVELQLENGIDLL